MTARRIVIADAGPGFDGTTVGQHPLGGVESATVNLAEALAQRGHEVRVFNGRAEPLTHRGVRWLPLRQGLPARADLFIANRDPLLLAKVPFARARVLWLHNPCGELDTWRNRAIIAATRPRIVVLGAYHRATCPRWFRPGDVATIPLAVADPFLAGEFGAPAFPPRAIFTSNPGRNLDWLLRLWSDRIHPAVPLAQLHLFSGPEVYQQKPGTGLDLMQRVLAQADALVGRGVVRHSPVGRDALIGQLAAARVMLYRGHPDETFCLALAEAQAQGVPCVVQQMGSAAERVRDGMTGFVADDEDRFAECAIRLLTDDALAAAMRAAALASQRGRDWVRVAQEFEELMPA